MKQYTRQEVTEILKQEIREAGSLRKWADKHGIQPATVSTDVRELWSTVSEKTLNALGFERRIVFVKKGPISGI